MEWEYWGIPENGLCSKGPNSYTISFSVAKQNIKRGGTMWFKLYKQRVSFWLFFFLYILISGWIPILFCDTKKSTSKQMSKKYVFWGYVFSKTTLTILNQCYLTLNKISIYKSLDGWDLSNHYVFSKIPLRDRYYID